MLNYTVINLDYAECLSATTTASSGTKQTTGAKTTFAIPGKLPISIYLGIVLQSICKRQSITIRSVD